jgi:predicted nucleic acid-binding protein
VRPSCPANEASAAGTDHPLGQRVVGLLHRERERFAGVGSALLIPEVLSKPLRDGGTAEVRMLAGLLGRLDLRPVDRATAELATALAIKYGLKAADAIHLATAVAVGADRFLTNNRRDFPPTITEVSVIYPADMPDETR